MKNLRSEGLKYLERYLSGQPLTRRQAMLAKCCECMGYYDDGLEDCEMPDCPLYPWMPYRNKQHTTAGLLNQRIPGKRSIRLRAKPL